MIKAVAGEGCTQELTYNAKAIVCIRDWLDGEDPYGFWVVKSEPNNSNLQPLLVGDEPCIDKDEFKCGVTQLMYIVGDPCCYDTAYVNPIKCCLAGISNCN